jgi:hypothetical protein
MGRRRLTLVSLAASWMAAAPAFAQATGARVRGAVFDSVASSPLIGARIELVADVDRSRIAYSTTSDSLGRFVLPGVARGRYIAGFFHPMLDSLGLALSQRWLDVPKDDGDVGFDLAVPSASRIHQAICAPAPKPKGVPDSAGVVMGYVLSAHTLQPQSDATVIAQWTEYTISSAGLQRQLYNRTATSMLGGWFAVCGVPSASDVVVRAVSGNDTSGAIEIRIPGSRLVRRTLYVASHEVLALAAEHDTIVQRAVRALDTTTTPTRTAIVGTVLTGWVRTEDGVPIPGAQVRLFGSPVTGATNDEGAFVLLGVPGGTQTLQTRAIGFVPDERAVDVTDQHLPIIVGLTSVRRFIDTVHVRAARLDINNIVGFESRRRAGSGRFFSASDIDRIRPREVTDILRHAPSVQLVSLGTANFAIRMRGDHDACQPALFLDGKQLVSWELSDLNSLIRPNEIGGMEIYTPSMTPVEFRTRQGCGTIVIWTRVPEQLSRRR